MSPWIPHPPIISYESQEKWKRNIFYSWRRRAQIFAVTVAEKRSRSSCVWLAWGDRLYFAAETHEDYDSCGPQCAFISDTRTSLSLSDTHSLMPRIVLSISVPDIEHTLPPSPRPIIYIVSLPPYYLSSKKPLQKMNYAVSDVQVSCRRILPNIVIQKYGLKR